MTVIGDGDNYMRWNDETKAAAEHLGFEVVESRGVGDYQGWGVHLLKRKNSAVMVEPMAEEIARDAELQDAALASPYARADVVRAEHLYEVVIWGVLAWSYGSCGGCDSYERLDLSTPELCVVAFGELVETRDNEDDARMLFSERQSW